MDKNRAIIFVEGSAGGTFLDWTLFYFSQTEKFYNPLNKILSDVVVDPITTNNAHHHNKIHPTSMGELEFCIKEINQFDDFYSMYVDLIEIPGEGITSLQFLQDNQFDLNNKWPEYSNKRKESYMTCQDFLANNNLKTLIIRANNADRLYNFFNKNQRALNLTPEEGLKIFYNKFFGSNKDKWDQFNYWDYREDLALSLRPFDCSDIEINMTLPNSIVYELTFSQVLNELDVHLDSLLTFFNLDKNIEKLNIWNNVYRKWQKIHDIDFYRNWPIIIDKILVGEDFDLSTFKMNFLKDVFIQHILIYKYNLNIKGFNVKQLPMNTKLIHDLLEENIHSVDPEYRNLLKNAQI